MTPVKSRVVSNVLMVLHVVLLIADGSDSFRPEARDGSWLDKLDALCVQSPAGCSASAGRLNGKSCAVEDTHTSDSKHRVAETLGEERIAPLIDAEEIASGQLPDADAQTPHLQDPLGP